MKSLALILAHLSTPLARRNVKILVRLHVLLVIVVAGYSALFHLLMAQEGQSHSWPTSVYWTLVTMSTLGFGDITFTSDIGRLFSVVVLLSGAAFVLVLLPFTFIQFIYVPLMEARQLARAPRELPLETEGHVLLTAIGPIEDALIRRLEGSATPYTVMVGNLEDALLRHDEGYRVMVGDLDDPEAWRLARVERAALVATTRSDTANTNIAFTVREINGKVPIVATADAADSLDILQLAGCNEVLQLADLLGRSLAQRVLGPDGQSQVVGRFGDLLVAEAVAPPDLIGRSLSETGLRQELGINVAGAWDRGSFEVAGPDMVVRAGTVLVMTGGRAAFDAYDATYGGGGGNGGPVLVIGAGRVGQAAARELTGADISYRIVDRDPERMRDPATYVIGDAADIEVLREAGIGEASSVVITTHDDDINVYLTIYCRRLRPDAHLIARANVDRNVSTLHRAGADFVLSYASTGATAIWNVLTADTTLQVAEGLAVFKVGVPPSLAGLALAQSRIRTDTGCSVVAVVRDGLVDANPDPTVAIPAGSELVLIGDSASERRFLDLLPETSSRGRRRRVGPSV